MNSPAWTRVRAPSAVRAFSLVEIVIGLSIMSMLVGVTVTAYDNATQRAREQIAQDEARAIGNAIVRWQLDHQRDFPFESVFPLVPQYLRNVKNDPWGNVFRIDRTRRVVISSGPDPSTESDDIEYFFGAAGDVAPRPPQNLRVRLEGTNIVAEWDPPPQDVDGSKPVKDLKHFEVEIRPSDTVETKLWTIKDMAADGFPCPQSLAQLVGTTSVARNKGDLGTAGFYPAPPDPDDRSYYFTVRAVDCAGNRSLPSNQAGLFVAKEVKPRIVAFRPSSLTPAVSGTLSFYMDVSDADSNLVEVRLLGWRGGTRTWRHDLPPPWNIDNRFRFLRNWASEPAHLATIGVEPAVYLEAVDPENVATFTVPIAITVTNTAPRVTALNPGIQLLTVNPNDPFGGTRTIDFTFEANDPEANMSLMRVRLLEYTPAEVVVPAPDNPQDFALDPPGSVMVRTKSFVFDITNRHDYAIEVTARDTAGAWSVPRKASVQIKEDTTPPDALTVSVDGSNMLLATSAWVGGWFFRTQNSLRFGPDAFEVESPPITYQVKITTQPLRVDGGSPTYNFDTIGDAQSITQGAGSSDSEGWYDFPESALVADPVLKAGQMTISVGAGLKAPGFNEYDSYFLGLRAKNSSQLTNFVTATPVHGISFQRQVPIRMDKTPPRIEQVLIEGRQYAGTTWVTNLMDAGWTVTDPVAGIPGNPPAAGSDRYRYQLSNSNNSGGPWTVLEPFTEVQTLELNSHPLPCCDLLLHNNKYIQLEIEARDRAGNWSVAPVASVARVDFTSPDITAPPVVSNQVGGVISVLDTFAASWGPPGSPFSHIDNESNVESWEWGIATTAVFVGFPDIFGWQPVISSVTSASISQNNLLVNGDRVHAVVRARNYAGSVSYHSASTAALVDASLFTTLQGTPSAGLSPLSVQFTATVSGGLQPYEVAFQFDGTDRKQYVYTGVTGAPPVALSTGFQYDLAVDPLLPRPEIICRLIVLDAEGRESRKDFIVDVRDDLLMGVAFENKPLVQISSYNGSGFTELFTVSKFQSTRLTEATDLGIEPRGGWLAQVGALEDRVVWSRLDRVEIGPTPTAIVAAGSVGLQRPDANSFTFARGVPSGSLVQTFSGSAEGVSGLVGGQIRRVSFKESGPQGSKAFGSDVSTARDFRGATASGTTLSEGVLVHRDTVSGQFRLRFVGALGTLNPAVDFAATAAPQALDLPDVGFTSLTPPPSPTGGNLPDFGTRVVGSRSGIYLISLNQSTGTRGLMKVVPAPGGLTSVTNIAYGAPQTPKAPMGHLRATEDGQFYVVGIQDGANWRLSAGRTDQTTFTDPGGTVAGELLALEVEEGGTRFATVSDNGGTRLVRVGKMEYVSGNPVVTYAAVGGGVLNYPIPSFGGPAALPSSAVLFRRPFNGFPKLMAILSQDETSVAGTLQVTVPNLLLRGANLDKALQVRLESGANNVLLSGASLDRTGLPPAAPFNPNGPYTHVPTDGDGFHFLMVSVPFWGSLPPGPQSLKVTAIGAGGSAGASELTTTICKPGSC